MVLIFSCNEDNIHTKEFSIYIPEYLKPSKELLDTAEIQFESTKKSLYIAVEKQKDTFARDEDFYKKNIYSLYDFIDKLDTSTIEINGRKAKKIFIKEEADQVYDWQIRVLKKDDYFYIIWIWTPNDKYDRNKKDIEKIISSFKFS